MKDGETLIVMLDAIANESESMRCQDMLAGAAFTLGCSVRMLQGGRLVLIAPELLKLAFRLDSALIRRLLVYSLPLMVAGLPGIMNDVLERVLMRFCNADPVNWRADLGVYQAAVKLAVIMQLFVQMFRYAAEPFFFQRERDKGSKNIYVDVLNYFTAFCMFG